MQHNLFYTWVAAHSPRKLHAFDRVFTLDVTAKQNGITRPVLVDMNWPLEFEGRSSMHPTFEEVLITEAVKEEGKSMSEYLDDLKNDMKQSTLIQLGTRCYKKTNDSILEQAISAGIGLAGGASKNAARGTFTSAFETLIKISSGALDLYQLSVFTICLFTDYSAAKSDAEKAAADAAARAEADREENERRLDYEQMDESQYRAWEIEDREWINYLA